MERSRTFFWNRLRWNLISSHLPAGSCELVDVGAGPGFLGDFLREHHPGIEYGYVEPLESLASSLRDRFGPEADRSIGNFQDASFVTLLDVLEHQENDREFLAELAGKMAPGSTLLLTVPAMPWLWSDWDDLLGHYQRYTKSSLRTAIGSLPFEIKEQSYLFPELIPLGLLRRLRMRSGADEPDPGAAEFPDLPDWLNEALFRVGSATVAGRRLWPAGTSLFAVLMRTN